MVQPETRPSLILRLGDPSDNAAWADFIEIYEPMLLSLASRWGLQDADAREVVQETLMAVANAIPNFHARQRSGSFRSWLSTITRNKLADHLARRARQINGTGDTDVHQWLNQYASSVSSASVWDWQQKQHIFTWAADQVRRQVSEKTWRAFYATSVCDRPVKEVAEELSMREGMVYVARSRVMSRLRKAVDAWVRQDEEGV